jgi:apolipoprotein N-acyltransferase
LIPFGEYTPGSTLLPWLETINANTGGFTPGTEATVFEYPLRRDDGSPYTLRVSPLICYEDTVPRLSRQATFNGAQLLVNLTNDAWFGRTAAPYEHHLIASFRAIENRRFLVRATNTGVTSVVDPLGRTIARLPDFSEGTLSARVALLEETSLYTKYFGEWPWWGLSLVVVVDILLTKRAFETFGRARPAAGTAGPPGVSLTPPR